MTWLLIPAVALANRLCGWDRWPLSKAGAMLIPAALLLVCGLPPLSAAVVFFGVLIWRGYNTGPGFAAITGRREPNDVDPLGLWLVTNLLMRGYGT